MAKTPVTTKKKTIKTVREPEKLEVQTPPLKKPRVRKEAVEKTVTPKIKKTSTARRAPKSDIPLETPEAALIKKAQELDLCIAPIIKPSGISVLTVRLNITSRQYYILETRVEKDQIATRASAIEYPTTELAQAAITAPDTKFNEWTRF